MSPCACTCSTDNWEYVQNMSREVLGDSICQFIDKCRSDPQPESQLIAILHRVQAQYGWLNAAQLDAVAQLLQVPAAKVSGVASFYHFFNFSPRGKHRISICMGTACFVKGAGRVLDRLRELLGVDIGQTTPDKLFSVDIARCVGACALAPVMIVDEKVYAEVKPDQVAKILGEYGFEVKKAPAAAK